MPSDSRIAAQLGRTGSDWPEKCIKYGLQIVFLSLSRPNGWPLVLDSAIEGFGRAYRSTGPAPKGLSKG